MYSTSFTGEQQRRHRYFHESVVNAVTLTCSLNVDVSDNTVKPLLFCDMNKKMAGRDASLHHSGFTTCQVSSEPCKNGCLFYLCTTQKHTFYCMLCHRRP